MAQAQYGFAAADPNSVKAAQAKYRAALKAGTYYGSSGYWGGPPIPGQSPGEAGKANLAASLGLTPQGASLPNRYDPAATATGTSASDLLKPYVIERNPALNKVVTGLYDEFDKGGAAIPGFDDVLKNLGSDQAGVRKAFDVSDKSLDLTGYYEGQRRADANASALTDRYAGTTRGLVDQAGQATSRYGAAGEADLAALLANAKDSTWYQKSIDDALGVVGGNMNRNQIGTGTGSSSGNAAYGMSAAVRATLPFRLQQQREVSDVLSRYLPFHGDVASREDANLRLGLGNESNLYGAQTGDVLRGKGTEASIQDLKIKVAGMGVDNALRRLASERASVETMVAVLGLPAALIREKLQAAGMLSALDEQANFRGVDYLPGANVADPRSFPANLPNDYPGVPALPNRYAPVPATAPNARYPLEIQRMLDRNANQRYAPVTAPFNYTSAGYYPQPNPDSGGGYITSGGETTYMGNFMPQDEPLQPYRYNAEGGY